MYTGYMNIGGRLYTCFAQPTTVQNIEITGDYITCFVQPTVQNIEFTREYFLSSSVIMLIHNTVKNDNVQYVQNPRETFLNNLPNPLWGNLKHPWVCLHNKIISQHPEGKAKQLSICTSCCSSS